MQTNNKAKTTSASSAKTSRASRRRSSANKRLLIDVDNVTARLGTEIALKNVSFGVSAGEFVGLIGPNGAGKTTLLKIVLGLLEPTTGRVAQHDAAISYIPQHGFAYDSQVPISVTEVVSLGSKDAAAIRQSLADVHLPDIASKRFSDLSGGQQQRVLIAQALAAQPSLLILDEPTAGIDEQSQREFYQILRELQSRGITIIMVSHDVDTVLDLVTRVVCLNRFVLYDGSPEHFELDQYLPQFYNTRHRVLHHHHEGDKHA